MNIHKLDTKDSQSEQDLTQQELQSLKEENAALRQALQIKTFQLEGTEYELKQLRARYHALQANGGGVSSLLNSLVRDMELNDGEHMIALFSKEPKLSNAA